MTDSFMFMPPSRPSMSSASSGFSNLLVAPSDEWKMRISDLSWRCAMLQLQSEAKQSKPASGQKKIGGTAKQGAESPSVRKAGESWWDRLHVKHTESGKNADMFPEKTPRSNTKVGTKEDVEAFLYRAERAMEKKKEAVAELQQKVEAAQETFSYRPQLTKAAKDTGRSYKDLLAWHKAIGDRMKEAQEMAKDKELEECTFQPKPASFRPIFSSEKDITERLWSDAQTRAARLKIKQLANSNLSLPKSSSTRPRGKHRTSGPNMSSVPRRELKQNSRTSSVWTPKPIGFHELVVTHANTRPDATSSTTPRKPAAQPHNLASFAAPTVSSSDRVHSLQSGKPKPAQSARVVATAALSSTGGTLTASKVPACVARPQKVLSPDHGKFSSTPRTEACSEGPRRSLALAERSEPTLSIPHLPATTRVSGKDLERLKQVLVVEARSRALDRALSQNAKEKARAFTPVCVDATRIASKAPRHAASMRTSSPRSTACSNIDEPEEMRQGLVVTPRSCVSDHVTKSRNTAEQAYHHTMNLVKEQTKSNERRDIEEATLTNGAKSVSADERGKRNINRSADPGACPIDHKYHNSVKKNTAENDALPNRASESARHDAHTGSTFLTGKQDISELPTADAHRSEEEYWNLFPDALESVGIGNASESDEKRHARRVTLTSDNEAEKCPKNGEQNRMERTDVDFSPTVEKKRDDISVDVVLTTTGSERCSIIRHKTEKCASQLTVSTLADSAQSFAAAVAGEDRKHEQNEGWEFLSVPSFFVDGKRVVLRRAEGSSGECLYNSHHWLDTFELAYGDDSVASMSPVHRLPDTEKIAAFYVSPTVAALSDRIIHAVARGLLDDDKCSEASYNSVRLSSGEELGGMSEDREG